MQQTPVNRKTSFKQPPTTITDRLVSQEVRRAKALEDQKRRRAGKVDALRNLDGFANLNLDETDQDEDSPEVLRQGVASFAPLILLEEEAVTESSGEPSPIEEQPQKPKAKVKRPRKRKSKSKKDNSKVPHSRWADKCMYAELLELEPELDESDGIPDDLETAWVAIPVPKGKRCLAVTYQGTGRSGEAVSTTETLLNLHSRLQGKPLMPAFPSPLPPNTILDCILDSNWIGKEQQAGNGILHVLDVIKWNGRDVGSCEVGFRLWWRDTRFAELPEFPAQSTGHPHPTTLLPVPYFTDLSFSTVLGDVIPASRVARPVPSESNLMDMDSGHNAIQPDGLLLYLQEASYESGTGPLSCWIPLIDPGGDSIAEAPLDKFERLLRKRIEAQGSQGPQILEVSMEM